MQAEFKNLNDRKCNPGLCATYEPAAPIGAADNKRPGHIHYSMAQEHHGTRAPAQGYHITMTPYHHVTIAPGNLLAPDELAAPGRQPVLDPRFSEVASTSWAKSDKKTFSFFNKI